MGVYNTEYDDLQGFADGGHNERRCSNCGGSLLYPFLAWDGKPGIFLCRACGQKAKRGLIADLVQFDAVLELRRHLDLDVTLVRTSQGKLVAEGKRWNDEALQEMEVDRVVSLKKGK